jgi:pectinesterase
MKKLTLLLLLGLMALLPVQAANKYDNPDTLFVSRDGTCEFRNIDDAIEVCRAFMDYHKVIFVKKGVYKEKLIIPSWLTHIEICGEDRDNTIITYDDHANIKRTDNGKPMGTFRTYTLKIEGSDITLRKHHHREQCRPARTGRGPATRRRPAGICQLPLPGQPDTVYTGVGGTRLYFKDCYIEGTTDFIFGPSTAWFEHCHIFCKTNSYITAASRLPTSLTRLHLQPLHAHRPPGCRQGISRTALAPLCLHPLHALRPGRLHPPEGWFNWSNPDNEKTARYLEYNNHGAGAPTGQRVAWARQLTKKEAAAITTAKVFANDTAWLPKE